MPSSGLIDRLRRSAPWLLVILLLGAFAVLLTWQILAWIELIGTTEDAGRAAPPTTDATPDLERLDILFGTSPEPERTTQTIGAVPIILHGSFVSADPERSSAVLQVGDEPPKRYRVGDELTRGVRLHRVFANRVQLRRNGRLETLAFPRPDGEASPMLDEPMPDDAPPPPTEAPIEPDPQPAESPPPSGPPPGVMDPPPEAVPDVPGQRSP